jgi:hypothetical protein
MYHSPSNSFTRVANGSGAKLSLERLPHSKMRAGHVEKMYLGRSHIAPKEERNARRRRRKVDLKRAAGYQTRQTIGIPSDLSVE